MNKMINVSKKAIIAGLLFGIVINLATYNRYEIKEFIAYKLYDATVKKYTLKTVLEMDIEIKNQGASGVYYLGRRSCSDCRESIRKIEGLRKEIEKEYKKEFYYVKLPEKPDANTEDILASLEIEEIPTLIYFDGEENHQCAYQDIATNDKKSTLSDLMGDKNGT